MKFDHSCPHFPSYSPFQGMETALWKGWLCAIIKRTEQPWGPWIWNPTLPCPPPLLLCAPGLQIRPPQDTVALQVCTSAVFHESATVRWRMALSAPHLSCLSWASHLDPRASAFSSPWQRSVLNGSPSLKEHKVPWRFLRRFTEDFKVWEARPCGPRQLNQGTLLLGCSCSGGWLARRATWVNCKQDWESPGHNQKPPHCVTAASCCQDCKEAQHTEEGHALGDHIVPAGYVNFPHPAPASLWTELIPRRGQLGSLDTKSCWDNSTVTILGSE